MNKNIPIAAAALLSWIAIAAIAPRADAQGVPTRAAAAARLAKLKAQQAASIAAANATAQPTPTQVATINRPVPTVVPTTTPTAVPTAVTTATAAPRPSATAAASASAKPVTSASAVPVTSASAAPAPVVLALDIDALRKTRADRRHAEFSGLQARWGELLSDPRAATELKLHAQRSAYLQRIRALGDKAKDTAFVSSVDTLITKEDTRDADAMNALRSGALPVGTAAPPVPAAAPAAGAAK
ncbi:MAG: hypothetical protein ABJB12_22040 [Pseudomonadota bacterium]